MTTRVAGCGGSAGMCRAMPLAAAIAVPLAGTPGYVIDRVHRELVRVVALPDVRERLISIGMVPETSTPGELATKIRAEVARCGPIIKAAGIAQE